MTGPVRKKRKLPSKSNGRNAAVPAKQTSNEPKHTLYINNLADHVDIQRLRSNLYFLFSIYGEVIKITINTKRQRGQAFITMKSVDEANLAVISLDNEPFFGKPLRVSFSCKETISL